MQAQIGMRVRLTRKKCVKHFQVGGMPVTGTIDGWRGKAYNDRHWRIKFDDKRVDWYAVWEFRLHNWTRLTD